MKWLQILTFVMVAILFVGFIGIGGWLLGWWQPCVSQMWDDQGQEIRPGDVQLAPGLEWCSSR